MLQEQGRYILLSKSLNDACCIHQQTGSPGTTLIFQAFNLFYHWAVYFVYGCANFMNLATAFYGAVESRSEKVVRIRKELIFQFFVLVVFYRIWPWSISNSTSVMQAFTGKHFGNRRHHQYKVNDHFIQLLRLNYWHLSRLLISYSHLSDLFLSLY